MWLFSLSTPALKGADPHKAFLAKVGEVDTTLNKQPCLCHTVKDSLVRGGWHGEL